MKRKIFSILFALVLVLTLSLVAAPVAAADSGTFTVANGTYTTVRDTDDLGNISATLPGAWVDTAMTGHFTATGTGDFSIDGEAWGTTATIAVSGTLSAGEITFSGTAARTAGDPITDDSVTLIAGPITIQPGGALDATLTGMADVPGMGSMPCTLIITGSVVITSTVDMTASYPAPVIGISVSPASVSFGEVTLGTPAPGDSPVTVLNTGNVDVDLTASIENESSPDVYSAASPNGLTIDGIDGSHYTVWSDTALVGGGTGELPLILTMPDATPPGNYTATLVFWAEAAGS